MPSIPLGRASYDRAELPPITLKNYYYEATPANLEDQVALIPRPRLKAFATAGAGPIRGIYREGGVLAAASHSGVVITLSNDQLYRIPQTGSGSPTLIGTVEGSFRMSAEGNADVVVLACGTKVYQTDGDVLTQITFPDSKEVSAIDTLNSYFLFCSELGRFYWSAIGGTTVNALDYATAESQPDVLLTLKVIGDELWLFGRLSVEVWQPTGDLDLPFQRIGGRIFGIGITSRETCAKINVGGIDTVCWVGTDRRVYRTNPNPERISDHAMEERLARATVSTTQSALNPYGAAYSWNGHDFYILHIPGEGSFAYDLTTGQWEELTSYGKSLFRGQVSTTGINAQPLFGDDTSNQVWEMSTAQITDGTDPVIFECSGLLDVTGAPMRCNNVILDIATGGTTDIDADPMIGMEWSDDEGGTFGDEVLQPLGRAGERGKRVMWTRCGQLRKPGRIFRWRTTQPATVKTAKYNESYR